MLDRGCECEINLDCVDTSTCFTLNNINYKKVIKQNNTMKRRREREKKERSKFNC